MIFAGSQACYAGWAKLPFHFSVMRLVIHVIGLYTWQIDFLIRDTTFFSGDDLLNPKSARLWLHVFT